MADLSLDLLFPVQADKENMLAGFAAMGDTSKVDPFAHLSAEEKEAINNRLKLIGNKVILPVEDYVSSGEIIQPDTSNIQVTGTQVVVLKKFGTYNVNDILNISDLSNIEFLLKFNIVNYI